MKNPVQTIYAICYTPAQYYFSMLTWSN